MVDSLFDSLRSGSKNTHTTVLGMIVAVCSYVASVGTVLPTTSRDWLAFAASAAIAALGVLAKDARTGSQPGGTK